MFELCRIGKQKKTKFEWNPQISKQIQVRITLRMVVMEESFWLPRDWIWLRLVIRAFSWCSWYSKDGKMENWLSEKNTFLHKILALCNAEHAVCAEYWFVVCALNIGVAQCRTCIVQWILVRNMCIEYFCCAMWNLWCTLNIGA